MLITTSIEETLEKQKRFFASGKTKNVNFRIEQLNKLESAIKNHEPAILKALKEDLNKPEFEAYIEMAVISDIKYARKNIKSWVKPKKVKTPIDQFPASARIHPEPLGSILIISPWNYPFSLMINPLIGAIAAGNCAVLKPSEIAPATSKVLRKIIEATFTPEYISIFEGGAEISQELLAEKFDHIFFTGGTKIGQIVMEAAAKNLTPVTLELGGKSPCIVERNIDLKESAKRIAWGKFLNSGQTCIAPDYLLVERTIKNDLVTTINQCIKDFYGTEPQSSPDYARIVSQRHFERLVALLQDGKIITGGQIDEADLYIAPTLMDNVALDAPLMQEEIFGPILPIIEYTNLEEAIAFVNERPKPLALYIFSKDKIKQQKVINSTSSGGVCINDTIMHVGVPELPFGGVGNSGIGNYHGKASFDTFSHHKSILQRYFWFDLNWRYAPYKNKIEQIKRLMK
ncbi:MAG: aldehyde dehydrogenase [Xenococcaceae cyanobacterium MO_188.B32]|nr:aldehyde dehydrogenase [Xenococcaceae cyanobacterium MO_188.B32]